MFDVNPQGFDVITRASAAERGAATSFPCHLLDPAGTYGDPEAGDPIQYD